MSADFRPLDPQDHRRPPGARDPVNQIPDDDDSPPIIAGDESESESIPETGPRVRSSGRGKRLSKPSEGASSPLTGQQRLLLLDTWRRSGLPAGDFAALVGGISKHTLYSWKKKFETEGPAGLEDKPRGGPTGSRLPEVTKRAILMLKQDNPDWGCEKISSMLLRGPALPACPQAVARVLHEAGYETEEGPTKPHPDKVRRFERARAQSALANGPLHLRAEAAEPPRLPGGVHGRPQPLHRRLRAARQPVGGAGDGGVPCRPRQLRAVPRRC